MTETMTPPSEIPTGAGQVPGLVPGQAPTGTSAVESPLVVVAYHSGRGHTAALAAAARDGAGEAGARAVLVDVLSISDSQWTLLDEADGVMFGSPTYMGSASSAFHAFAEASSKRWAAQAWRNKAASGFTVAGSMNGDKLHTLQYFSILAAQHGMHWVNLDIPPGWNSSTGSENDLNRLGINLGAGAQANTDAGDEGVTKADLETVRHLGRRVAQVAGLLRARR
ncbi:flavodoxin family protein [Streptomyces sp. NPDC006487]|uniref:flavodoxin family protein n=1 Tax=Streptomyces sp. NPDC006487 TaxID=3364748 RepID=UPI0036BA43BA